MAKPEILRSAANPLLKQVRRAVASGGLTAAGDCLAEGFHLLEEALRSGCPIRAVLASEPALPRVNSVLRGTGPRLLILEDALFRSVAATETAQGVLALVRPPAWDPDRLFLGTPLVLVLDGVQDPGNAGAMLRAAEAFGATGVLFPKGAVSPYNPKAVRGSAGSLFRVPLLSGVEPQAARAMLQARRLCVYAAMPAAAASLAEADLRRPCAIVIGSEGGGVGDALRSGASGIRIPVRGVESLNAAVAAAILLYEAARQRSGT